MALVTCVDCGRAVSDAAPACPGCGRPAPFAAPVAAFAQPLSQDSLARSAGRAVGRSSRGLLIAISVGLGLIVIAIVTANVISSRHERERVIAETLVREEEAAVAKRARAAADAKAAEEADVRRKQNVATVTSKSAGMSRDARDAWIAQCVTSCPDWQMDAVLAGAPEGKERRHAELAAAAASVRNEARKATDGESLSLPVVRQVSGIVGGANGGLSMLDTLPKSSIAEAKKDPAQVRGKVIRASGNIVEIRTTNGIAEGSIATDNLSIVRFVTPLATDNLFQDSWATFEGAFVQEYDFANVSGGQTKSVLLVGAFDIPPNRATR